MLTHEKSELFWNNRHSPGFVTNTERSILSIRTRLLEAGDPRATGSLIRVVPTIGGVVFIKDVRSILATVLQSVAATGHTTRGVTKRKESG